MSQVHKLVDVAEAKTFIEANWPNDPLLKAIALNLLDKLPAAQPAWIPADQHPELHMQKSENPDGSYISYEASAPVIALDQSGHICTVHYESGPLFQGWVDDRSRARDIAGWMPKPERISP